MLSTSTNCIPLGATGCLTIDCLPQRIISGSSARPPPMRLRCFIAVILCMSRVVDCSFVRRATSLSRLSCEFSSSPRCLPSTGSRYGLNSGLNVSPLTKSCSGRLPSCEFYRRMLVLFFTTAECFGIFYPFQYSCSASSLASRASFSYVSLWRCRCSSSASWRALLLASCRRRACASAACCSSAVLPVVDCCSIFCRPVSSTSAFYSSSTEASSNFSTPAKLLSSTNTTVRSGRKYLGS